MMNIQKTFTKPKVKINMQALPKIAFFGTPDIAVWVLDELEAQGITPSHVVTNPDAPQGRKLVLTPTPVALWAEERNIPVLKPETLKSPEIVTTLKNFECELFIVAAYGKMIPQEILDIPKYNILNVHPSLLPLLRGASPIRSAILQNMNPTGVSIMMLTAGMDRGPILAQEVVYVPVRKWPVRGSELDETLARKGGQLLAEIIPEWIDGTLEVQEQDHTQATYCEKITKDMGHIDLKVDAYTNFLKIRAFDGWPGTFFFHEKDGKNIRIKIIDAEFEDGKLHITRIIPEGKKEMEWSEFLKNT